MKLIGERYLQFEIYIVSSSNDIDELCKAVRRNVIVVRNINNKHRQPHSTAHVEELCKGFGERAV